ncbi:DUF1294 domain-containing protein [Agrobacterium rubi]|uniref:DUF1294 domain-containing protein n=1 Tax=Agrobacterium rubi TaxID=28099 RepID=UPI001574EB4A|nr:DUF1294 domain-containing protein [Agrobacterium rubi]NTF07574.1 DUF1294 domain-containing protein [Agrobacterium rubi]NTF19810.1 DUF1294 domain-containing protein [Agrobacterium rubi]NTF26775.1 DUF1294 domain-containing protein [Agrobacterium rubi]
MMMILLAVATYLTFNLIVFLIYGWDKRAARTGTWRVLESTLLWLALLGGSVGAVLAQHFLRHKTRKEPFRRYLICIIILQIGIGASFVIVPHWPKTVFDTLKAMAQKPNP